MLPFVDEHEVVVAAPAPRVWQALIRQIPHFAASETFAGLLGASPRRASGPPLAEGTTFPGFAVSEVVPEERLLLTGSHRFSRYALVLELAPQTGGTVLRARTEAEFPGFRGGAYRLLVIGSGAHRVLVKRLLRTIRERAEGQKGTVGGAMSTQREVDEAEIRRQVDKIIEGLRAKDLESLKRLYSTDVVSFDVEPPLQHVGVAAKLENWAKVFAFFESVNYEIRDLTVTAGDDVAFGHAFGRLSGTMKDGTATNGMWVRVTYCLRKIDGTWLIVHDQVSVPFDIHSGKGVVDLQP